MRVLFVNSDGGGFAGHIEIAEGMTIERLFQEQIPGGKAANYLIRVNRLPVAADQELRDGDRISVTPTKIEGAV